VPFNRFLILACALISFNEGYCQVDKDDWAVLDQAAFAISYPTSWSLDQTGKMGTTFILFSEQTNTDFRNNVNLIVQDLNGLGYDLAKYVTLSEGQVKTMITNSQIIDSKRMKSESGEFQEVVFTGEQGIFHLKWRQRYWVKGEKAFVLTFTASQVTYDQYRQVGEKVLDSFKLK
jgi:hypothetical protein